MVKPGFYRHSFKQGEDYDVTLPLEVDGILVDTSTMTGQSQIRTLDGALIAAFDISFPSSGYARFQLGRGTTALLSAKRYLHDAKFSTGVEETTVFYLDGDCLVSAAQTQGANPPPVTPQGNALYSNPYPSSANLSALRVVRLTASGELAYASSADQTHAFTVLGLLTVAIALGQSTTVLQEGGFADDNWSWTLGTPIWVGVDGALTQVPPESGFLLQVAIPKTPTSIEFEIQEPILL